MEFDPRLHEAIRTHPYPLVFATISGAHLYGFASPDSDYDLRGVHVLPPCEVMGLLPQRETIEIDRRDGSFELDLVTHDARKFFVMMMKKNGYVLEQLYSPLVVHTSAEHEALKRIGKFCITRFHGYHYLGFAETQWKLFEKEHPRRIKPLLYVYRVLLTGIHLMQTGEVQANLRILNDAFGLPQIPELIARKTAGAEKATLADDDLAFHQSEYVRLRGMLESAMDSSTLPEAGAGRDALHDLLLRIRGV